MEYPESVRHLTKGTIKRGWPALVLLLLDLVDVWERYIRPHVPEDWRTVTMPPWIFWPAIGLIVLWAVTRTYHEVRMENARLRRASEAILRVSQVVANFYETEVGFHPEYTALVSNFGDGGLVEDVRMHLAVEYCDESSGTLKRHNYKDSSLRVFGDMPGKLIAQQEPPLSREDVKKLESGEITIRVVGTTLYGHDEREFCYEMPYRVTVREGRTIHLTPCGQDSIMNISTYELPEREPSTP